MQKEILELLEPFHHAIKYPEKYARNWKKKNKRDIIGYFCSYAPEEIILASGALPFRIFGSSGRISLADAHLQAYSCSLIRGALEGALSGELDFLKGTVFPHTCDSIMRLSDLWRMNIGFDFHIDVVFPVKLNTKSAKTYMYSVVRKFISDLEKYMGIAITEEQIKTAIKTHNRIRKFIGEIYSLKYQYRGLMKGTDMYAVLRGAMIMDRYDVSSMLKKLAKALKNEASDSNTESKRILLVGGLCNIPDISQIIEESGGVIIGEDFCTGERYYEGQIRTDGDIIEAIGDRYLRRIVCPAKHDGVYSRGDHMLRQAREKRADGVIFLYLKFCDPHAFDYPYLKALLEKESIPSMVLEIEDRLPGEGQMKTRIEAFLEIL